MLPDWVFSRIALRKYDLTQGAKIVLFFLAFAPPRMSMDVLVLWPVYPHTSICCILHRVE